MGRQSDSIKSLVFLVLPLLALFACNSGGGPVIVECGGAAGFACPNGMYCNLGSACGGFDDRGVCTRQPTECPVENKPVCSCGGKTYASHCYAAASGASVAYEGSCIKETQKRPKRQKLEFPDIGSDVDGSAVEDAGDEVNDQYRPLS